MKTAHEQLIESATIKARFQMLATSPHLVSESIAKHYIAHAVIAQELIVLLQVQEKFKFDEKNPGFDFLIKDLTRQIQTNHAHDLGIKLEWPMTSNP
jgi:hypothetical protein